jgi:hypothetical protein|tara:strand:- start:469 stop:1062 length:594 start_codon:yes stop_codon:yes gene_type:complete
MSQRIERDFVFDTAIHFGNTFYLNQYSMTLSMLIETTNIVEQNIALERIQHFIATQIHGCLFISETETNATAKYKDAGISICTLPDEPHDQIISMVLLQKFNSVTEGRIAVTDLILGSTFSDGVRFHTVSEVAEDSIDHNPELWWNCSTLCIEHTVCPSGGDEKIVKLFSEDAWEKLDMGFSKKKGKTILTKLDQFT